MSAEFTEDGANKGLDDQKTNLLTTNFDTYAMILQMV